MTIDEAISHAEEIAQDKENLAGTLWDKREKRNCKECAEERRQIAGWLKDYKRLLSAEKTGHWVYTKKKRKQMKLTMALFSLQTTDAVVQNVVGTSVLQKCMMNTANIAGRTWSKKARGRNEIKDW